MGRINIVNTKTVIDNANSVMTNLTEIKSIKASIDQILSELKVYWAENGDQQKFASILSGELGTLNEIIYCTGEFCSAITDYVNALEATSSNVATGK